MFEQSQGVVQDIKSEQSVWWHFGPVIGRTMAHNSRSTRRPSASLRHNRFDPLSLPRLSTILKPPLSPQDGKEESGGKRISSWTEKWLALDNSVVIAMVYHKSYTMNVFPELKTPTPQPLNPPPSNIHQNPKPGCHQTLHTNF